MAVPAVDAIVGDVVLMAEWDRLILRHVDVGVICSAVKPVGGGDQGGHAKQDYKDADPRNAIGTSVKDLGHRLWTFPLQRISSECKKSYHTVGAYRNTSEAKFFLCL
jgi:hypothetical protein